MAITMTSTKDATVHGVKSLVYGGPGSGKTYMIRTLPNPVIISAEAGLLSLRDTDIKVLTVDTMGDVLEVYEYLRHDKEGQAFDTVAIDSLSEIAETVLSKEKTIARDGRAAYGEMFERMLGLVKDFRDLPEMNVYFTAKLERVKDDATGAMLYAPSMPGRQLGPQLPYLFDEVFVLRSERNAEGDIERWLQTQPDEQYYAKDRSGSLELFEKPDMANIIEKISSTPRSK